MPIRYFKCHTTPYPSYNLAASKGGTDELNLTWSNGPNGQAEPTATEVCVAYVSNTVAETCVTIPLNLTTYLLTLVGSSGQDVQIKIRRQNSAGFGEYTSPLVATMG